MSNTQNTVTPISLPPEIWLDILVELQSGLTEEEKTRKQKTIDNIVLVSRSYRDLIQPLLFKTFTISIRRGYWLDRLMPRLKGLSAFFDSRPEAAWWIKSLVVLRRGSVKLRQEEAALLEQVFLRMTNVRALHVAHLNITQAMYAHIYQLPALEDVNIEPNPGNLHLNGTVLPYGGLGIRKLRLSSKLLTSQSATAAFMQLALSPHLQQLEVGAQHFSESAWSLCTTYPEHSFSGLTSLTTAPPGSKHINSFFHFLASCPNITELRLQFPYSDYPVHGESQFVEGLVSPNILPRLSILYSPKSFAKLLVPGRSITELHLTNPQELYMELSMDDLRVLSTGSTEILGLHFGLIRIHFPDLLGSIADFFPRLRSFDLLYCGVVDTFTQDIKRLPDLERLHLRHGLTTGMGFLHDTLAGQKRCLDAVRTVQSSLKEVCFDWNRTWWWTDGGGWKRHDVDEVAEVEENYDIDLGLGL